MTDKPGPTPSETPGGSALRPDPLGTADPHRVPGTAAGDFTLHPDPLGLHDPAPHAQTAATDIPPADRAAAAADSVEDGVRGLGERAADVAGQMAGQVRERAADLAGDIQDRLQGRFGEAAGQARERASAAYDGARERASALHRQGMRRVDDLTVQGIDGLNRGRGAVERFVEENPLLVGVVGVAAGLLLGALLPRTRPEDRNLGPWADEVRDQGLRYAREMTHRGREFVHTALDPDNLNAAARRTAEDTHRPPEGERAQHNL